MMTVLQSAAFHLLCWAAFAKTESTSGRLWEDIALCDGSSLNNNYSKPFDNIISPLQCCSCCLLEKGCEHFLYRRQETRCLIFPPPCQQLLPGSDTGYQLFRTTEVAKCPLEKGYYYYSNSQLCLRQDHKPRTWNTARQFCETEGGHLMTINSDAEFTDFKHYILNVQDYPGDLNYIWLGATYDSGNKVWKWLDNTTLTTDFQWGAGQPDGTPGEVYLKISTTFHLNDEVGKNSHSVVCEADMH